MPEPREADIAQALPQSEGSPAMDQTAHGQQNPGVSNRTHWKNTILAGLANYIDAGSIMAGSGAHQFSGPRIGFCHR
jgi:hypothetical protein